MDNDNQPVSIDVKPEADEFAVEWTKNGVHGRLGPYQTREIAEQVMEAKKRELTENP